MSQPTYERLLSHLDRLALGRLKDALPAIMRQAEKDGWGHVQLLDRLLEEEVASREERRVKSSLKLAGLPYIKTLDSFDFSFQPSLDRSRLMDVFSLSFLSRKENVLFLGPPGVGKTHLAVALAVAACQSGASVYFTTLDQMIRSLAAADRAGKLDGKLRTFASKYQLLVCDEVGYLPLSRAEANYLFQVVSSRYEKLSLVLTSNKSFTEWHEVFGDSTIATAILDRIVHHAHVFSIKGNSYRLRERLVGALTPDSKPLTPDPRREAVS